MRFWKLEHIQTLLDLLNNILKSSTPFLHITLVSNFFWFYLLYINFLVFHCQCHNKASLSPIWIATTICRRLAKTPVPNFPVLLHTTPYTQDVIHIHHLVKCIQTDLLYSSEISCHVLIWWRVPKSAMSGRTH